MTAEYGLSGTTDCLGRSGTGSGIGINWHQK